MPRAASPILLIAVACAACGEAGAGSGWETTVETLPSGATQVTNTPRSADVPVWTLEEELRIGTVDGAGPDAFGQIKGLIVEDDGRIIVLDAQPQEIRVFDAGGAHLQTHGRRGAGPGEFLNALGLMRAGDGHLYVPDQQNARMSVVHPERGFITSHPLRLYMWGFVWDGVLREDGHIVVPSMTMETRRRLLRVYTLDMTEVDSILLPEEPPPPAEPPGAYAWEAPGGMPRGFATVPFYATGARYLHPSGDAFSSTAGDPSHRFARWTPGGDTTLFVQTLRDPVPVRPVERDSAINAIVEGLSRYGVRSLDPSRVPATKPGVLGIFTDDRDRIWVRTSSPDALRRYDVFAHDGRYAGSLATPLRIVSWIPPVIRGDSFHAVVQDELDVQYVVRARILVP
jgi:hypothetical protein